MTYATPAYDRNRLTPGIVHIGLGNFHRAHMAVYLDDLFAKGLAMDWAILGAGVRAGDAQMRAACAEVAARTGTTVDIQQVVYFAPTAFSIACGVTSKPSSPAHSSRPWRKVPGLGPRGKR